MVSANSTSILKFAAAYIKALSKSFATDAKVELVSLMQDVN